uniref:Peptidylprolyl isomerase n=1 Tax=Steinernema glaseri TaxID=37863 RepID=A0A1I7Z9S4_9BILA
MCVISKEGVTCLGDPGDAAPPFTVEVY